MLIQRIGNDQKAIHYLIKAKNEYNGCLDEVWLSTPYGYPKLSSHEKNAKTLYQNAIKLREAGIKVSLEITNTLGHGQYMSSLDCSGLVFKGSKVGNMVGYNGASSKYSFCYNDTVFRNYIKTALSFYSIIKPEIVWFDDDLRLCWHDPVPAGCFCDNCIAKFNKLFNYSYTRETLVNEIPHNTQLRLEYLQFMKDSVGNFVEEVCQSFHELSPESNFGHENASLTISTGGNDYIFSKMKKVTGKNPAFRPGGGAYNDNNPWDLLDKYVLISLGCSLSPDYVKYVAPEIENLPSTAYGSKSSTGTCLESSLYFAGGVATHMSYAMIRHNEELNFNDKYFKLFSKYKKYWEILVNLNTNTRQYGISYILPRYSIANDMEKNDSLEGYFSQWFDIHHYTPKAISFLGSGIPFSFGNNYSDVYILRYPNSKCLSEKEIQELLKKPCLCDSKSFSYLSAKYNCFNAVAEQIPLSIGHKLNMKYVDDCIFHSLKGKINPKGFLSNDFIKIIPTDNKCIPLSEYTTKSKELQQSGLYPYGISECIVQTSQNAKWAVFGSDLWNPCINYDRKIYIENLFEYLSGKKIKVSITNPQSAVLLPRENENGNITSVSVLNTSFDELTPEIIIRNPVGENFSIIDNKGKESAIVYKKKDTDYILKLPKTPAWNIKTVIIK